MAYTIPMLGIFHPYVSLILFINSILRNDETATTEHKLQVNMIKKVWNMILSLKTKFQYAVVYPRYIPGIFLSYLTPKTYNCHNSGTN